MLRRFIILCFVLLAGCAEDADQPIADSRPAAEKTDTAKLAARADTQYFIVSPVPAVAPPPGPGPYPPYPPSVYPDPPPDLPDTAAPPPPPQIMIDPEMPAQFPGGDLAKNAYILKHIVYPEPAKEQGIEGTSWISFTVETDGKLTDIKIIKSAHPMLDNEALRLVKSMPRWEPATHKGDPVRSLCRLPVRFKLN